MSTSDRDFTRRQLLVSGMVAAGYALAARPLRAEAIQTDAAGLITGPVSIPTPSGAMPAYRARPEAGESFPVLLLVHEIFGVHEYIRDVSRRLAQQGYLVVAPDLYRRHGDVSKLESIDAVLELVRKVPDAEVLADLDASLAWAAQNSGDAERAVITGFCWGGRIVWLYSAHNPKLRAGVAWYGRLVGADREQTPTHPLDVASRGHRPVLGLYGGADRGIPDETVFEMRKKLAAAGGDSEIVVFPTAPHGFHADYRKSYRPLAAAEGWRRMLEWFERHGASVGG